MTSKSHHVSKMYTLHVILRVKEKYIFLHLVVTLSDMPLFVFFFIFSFFWGGLSFRMYEA